MQGDFMIFTTDQLTASGWGATSQYQEKVGDVGLCFYLAVQAAL